MQGMREEDKEEGREVEGFEIALHHVFECNACSSPGIQFALPGLPWGLAMSGRLGKANTAWIVPNALRWLSGKFHHLFRTPSQAKQFAKPFSFFGGWGGGRRPVGGSDPPHAPQFIFLNRPLASLLITHLNTVLINIGGPGAALKCEALLAPT